MDFDFLGSYSQALRCFHLYSVRFVEVSSYQHINICPWDNLLGSRTFFLHNPEICLGKLDFSDCNDVKPPFLYTNQMETV